MVQLPVLAVSSPGPGAAAWHCSHSPEVALALLSVSPPLGLLEFWSIHHPPRFAWPLTPVLVELALPRGTRP